jgi:hypothetical protein
MVRCCVSVTGALVVVTVKATPLLVVPPTVAVTSPLVAPLGTRTTMLVVLQLVTVAAAPLKRTTLPPCVVPKFVPVTVTEVPTGPEEGDRLVIVRPPPVFVTVHVNVLLFDAAPSDAVAVTVCEPVLDAVNVPEMSPVAALTVNDGGSPAAL